MNLQIITPEKVIFEGEVSLITLPGKSGEFQILDNHAPIVSTLTAGALSFVSQQTASNLDSSLKKNGNSFVLEINGGVAELNHNQLTVLAD